MPLVQGLIVSNDETDLQLISNFEQSMNDLGLVTKDRSDLNKTIVGVLIDQAEAAGLSGDGDIEGAENILDIALKFPYGVDGKLNLTAHPDYQGKVNTLKKQINDFAFTQEKRRQIQKERDKNDDIVNTIGRFAETGDANLITNLQKKYVLDAAKIGTAAVALDGNTRERSAQIEARIINDGFDSKADAATAALGWYLDERTPKTQANRTRLSQLLGVANGSENGDFTNLNKMLSELNSQLKGEFSGSDFIVGTTGQLNDKGSSAVNDLFNAAKLEASRYVLGEGKGVDPLTEIEKLEEIKATYLKKARDKANPFNNLNNNNNLQPNNENKEQNLSDIEGDANSNLEAGVFTEPTKEDIEREKALDKEEKSVLDEIDITKPFEYNSLERLAVEGGFTPEQAKIMAAIALAESSGKVRALNDDTETGDLSYGLWQINMIDYPTYKLGEERRKQMKLKDNNELYDPAVNVRAAKMIFDQQGYDAWSVYKSGAYKKFLPKTN